MQRGARGVPEGNLCRPEHLAQEVHFAMLLRPQLRDLSIRFCAVSEELWEFLGVVPAEVKVEKFVAKYCFSAVRGAASALCM